jgi:MOSC domain-containing protein YiiM
MSVVRAVSRHAEYSFSKPNRDEIVLVAGLGVEGDVHAGVTVRHRGRVRADPRQPNLRQVHLIQGELFDEVAEAGYSVAPGQLGENVTTSGVDLLGLPRGTVLRFGTPQSGNDGAGKPGDGSRPTAAGKPGDGSRPTVAGVAEGGRDVRAAGLSGDQGHVRAVDVAGGGSHGAAAGEATARSAPVAGVVAAAAGAKLDGPTAAAVDALVAAAERAADPADPRPAVIVTGLRNPCLQIDNFSAGLLKEVAFRDERGAVVRKAGVMSVVLRGGPVRPGDPVAVELPPPPHQPLDRV